VLLLAVGPQAQRGGWSAQAAIAIAEALAEAGSRIILADLSLDDPELHDLVGLDNNEGLTDVFLFGASLEHVTRMLPAHSFELIPAAAFTPDAEEILTHRRWSILFEEYAASNVKLLLYMPIAIDGASAFSDRVGHTIVLAEPQELDDVRAALSVDAEIMAVLKPPSAADDIVESEADVVPMVAPVTPRAPARTPDDDFAKIRIPKDSAREALIADLRSRQRAALQAPPPIKPASPDEVDVASAKAPAAPRASMGFPPPRPGLHEPTFATRARPKKKKPSRLLVPLLAALVVSSLAAGWHYYGGAWWADYRATRAANQSNGQPGNQQGPTNSGSTGAQTPVTPAKPEGVPMPYSVAIGIYPVLDQANQILEHYREEASDLSFYIAPTVVQAALYYRVFAGPLPDSASAAAVRDTLMARKLKTYSGTSDLVSAPLAFHIGTYLRRVDAEIKAREIAIKGVPAYIVPINSATGMQYNIYVGAFAGRGDAEFMRDILQQASLPDTLVERTGSIRS
jgi:cell division septation protein DedD